jgi:hypothetical protein
MPHDAVCGTACCRARRAYASTDNFDSSTAMAIGGTTYCDVLLRQIRIYKGGRSLASRF